MNTPNPANIFGRRMPLRTPESLPSPTRTNEEPVIPAAPEKTTDESAKALVINHTLGNRELPIADFREKIVGAVHASQATIITAETGAGKSTQVPQFLAEAGYEVVVTQPRVVAARSVSEWVRDEVVAKRGDAFADFVGYRTSRERKDSVNNQILFATDGLQLVRELSGHGVGKKQALVLDEVHEWNENMEVLVAWAKQRMNDDPNFKVVVMSATMEAGPLATYFADGKREVPVIDVPGRTFEVKKEEGGDVADQAIKMAKEGKNTLVFVPGKAEISKVIAEIERANVPGATALPLHGSLEPAEQRRVFAKYPGVKIIVATNVAQTSITIEDIDAVVDSGLERRNEVKNGVEGLFLHPISQADCLQRAGRAGRTKAGEYVLAQLDNNPFMPLADREEYGTPEILRTRLDGMVLRLAKNDFDAAAMDFFHSKDKHGRDITPEIAVAKERLRNLGALREDGSVTQIGRDMERMPVESHYARMMIEARKYGPEVQMQLAALIAVQTTDGIVQRGTRNKPCQEQWRALLNNNFNDSDMIKQLEVFVAAQKMSDKEKRDHDLYVKAFSRANDAFRQLRSVEKLQNQDLSAPTAEQRAQLIKCIISGMVDNLYIQGYNGHANAKGDTREVSQRSIIQPGKMVVGTPFDLQITTSRGLKTLNLLEGPTNVPSVDVLREVAPQLFVEKYVGYAVDAGRGGVIVERWKHYFNGHDMDQTDERDSAPSEERRKIIIGETIIRAFPKSYYEINDEINRLQKKTDKLLSRIGTDTVRGMLEVALPLETDSVGDASEYFPPVSIDDLLGSQEREEIDRLFPDHHFGLDVTYAQGVGTVDIPLDSEELSKLPDEALVLPSGQELLARSGAGRYKLRDVRERAIEKTIAEQIANEKRIIAEAAAAEHQAKVAAHEAIKQGLDPVEAALRDIGNTPDLNSDFQRDVERLMQRIERLRWIDLGEVDDYPNQINSVAGLVRALGTKVDAWVSEMKSGTVTTDALEALKKRFNS